MKKNQQGRASDQPKTLDVRPLPESRGRARRRLLTSIAITGGTAISARSLPEAWKKPALDSLLLPTHAQTTGEIPVATFTCRVESIAAADDGSVITDGPFNEPGGDVATDIASVDDIALSGIQAEIDPPVSQPVILSYSAPTGIDGLPVAQDGTTDGVTGIADFPDADAIGGGGPFYDGDSPASEQLVLIFTTAGFDPCVLTLTFNEVGD